MFDGAAPLAQAVDQTHEEQGPGSERKTEFVFEFDDQRREQPCVEEEPRFGHEARIGSKAKRSERRDIARRIRGERHGWNQPSRNA